MAMPPDEKKPAPPPAATAATKAPAAPSRAGGKLPPPSPAGASGPPTLSRPAPVAATPRASPAPQPGPAQTKDQQAKPAPPPGAAPPAAKRPPPAPQGTQAEPVDKKKKEARRTLADFSPEFVSTVGGLWNRLDQSDYFEVLRLEKTATPAEIKKAYHRDSREFHPDRYFKLEDVEFRDQIIDIYKRVNEAYVTLRDDRKRAMYLQDVGGPEREKRLRWADRTEAEVKAVARKEVAEQVGMTPQGRKFYETAMKEFQAGKFAAAERNFKMALTFEPNNVKYKEMLKEAGKNIKMDFTIK